MTASTPRLQRSDLSAVCRSAADVSACRQRRTKQLVRCELVALIMAGAAGIQSLRVGPARLDLLAALGGVFFIVSLVCLALRVMLKTEQAWYTARAGAESIRTLAWRYSVGGSPFPITMRRKAAADRYLAELADILHELHDVELAPTAPDDRELTPGMRALRAAPFLDRRATYKRDRIENQINWYTRRASDHDTAARRWLTASAFGSTAGVVAAGLRMFGVIDIDLLSIAATCTSAAIAWNQLNQNRNVVSAYRLTARELNIIRDRVDHIDEAEWPTFVSDSERAVSREHTLWLAHRGHPGLRQR